MWIQLLLTIQANINNMKLFRELLLEIKSVAKKHTPEHRIRVATVAARLLKGHKKHSEDRKRAARELQGNRKHGTIAQRSEARKKGTRDAGNIIKIRNGKKIKRVHLFRNSKSHIHITDN